MKFSKLILLMLTINLLSCGSSERVIMEDGKVYEIKGNKYFNNDNNVTELLSVDEKKSIASALNQRIKAERLAEERQKELEKEQKRNEKALKDAEDKVKAIEKKQEQLKDALEAKEDARQDFLKAKKRLQDKKEKYQKLKVAGKLSPRDEEKWNERFVDLEKDIKEANQKLENLK